MKNLTRNILTFLICLKGNVFDSNASSAEKMEATMSEFNMMAKPVFHRNSSTKEEYFKKLPMNMESTINDFGFNKINNEENLSFSAFNKTLFTSLGNDKIGDFEGTFCQALNPQQFAKITPSKHFFGSKANFHKDVTRIGEISLNESVEELLDTSLTGRFTLAHYKYSRSDKYPDLYVVFGKDCSEADFKQVHDILQNTPALNDFSKINATSSYAKNSGLLIETESYPKRAYGNLVQTSSKKRLSPLELYAINHEEFKSLNPTSSSSLETYDPGGERLMPIFQYSINAQGELVILSSPVHDLPQNTDVFKKTVCGGLSLREAWDPIEKFLSTRSESVTKILMPIGESNSLYGIKRNHWTMLSLTKKNNIWNAEFYNSKGPGDNLYNRQNMIEFLEEKLPKTEKLKMNFLGHQGMMNNVECGYFVADYIGALVQGENINESRTNDVRNTFDGLEKNLRTFK